MFTILSGLSQTNSICSALILLNFICHVCMGLLNNSEREREVNLTCPPHTQIASNNSIITHFSTFNRILQYSQLASTKKCNKICVHSLKPHKHKYTKKKLSTVTRFKFILSPKQFQIYDSKKNSIYPKIKLFPLTKYGQLRWKRNKCSRKNLAQLCSKFDLFGPCVYSSCSVLFFLVAARLHRPSSLLQLLVQILASFFKIPFSASHLQLLTLVVCFFFIQFCCCIQQTNQDAVAFDVVSFSCCFIVLCVERSSSFHSCSFSLFAYVCI